MAEDERMEHRKRHGRYGFIPAGVLIGLGVGLLAGYPGPGVLIGLGIGFIATGLVDAVKKTQEAAASQQEGMNVAMLLLGVFMILIGIGIVWMPEALWPYAVAGFLILLGIWFLVRGFYRSP
jgi:hypothetical protein